ncbi:uncharacterized protein LOC119084966 [Bradysia coprophila]|uniref:uncharacterized protein LOC119084966 n=1 Tax=Bradysia coprophila TaxID=38358 RepID=UPI00187D858F|nr:uncharacterized protein LOC119084966 [Bradysia coprophila]
MEIIRSATILIACVLVVINCAVAVKELPTDHPESVEIENKNDESAKRPIRQVAVNVGPVGVGVGPFGGVGVRVGPWFNLGVAPSYRRAAPLLYPAPVPVAYPVAYPAAVPVTYQATVPVTYQAAAPVQQKYSYSSNYRYNYAY